MTQHFVLVPNITVSHVDENNNFDNNNCNKNDDDDDDNDDGDDKNTKEQKVHLLELPRVDILRQVLKI